MGKLIRRNFYNRNTVQVAREVPGKILCRRMNNGKVIKSIIVEAEAYTQDEESCHAYKGITKRNAAMFKKPGIAYVYFTYGMYHCLNIIITQQKMNNNLFIFDLTSSSTTKYYRKYNIINNLITI